MDQRLFRTLGILIAALITTTPLLGAESASASDLERPSLDLAAMSLRPDDLVAQGLEGHEVTRSIMTEPGEMTNANILNYRWDASIPDGDAFLKAGAERTHFLHLSRDIQNDTTVDTSHLVISFTMEFADVASAEQGFDTIATQWATGIRMSPIPVNLETGDDHFMVEGYGTHPEHDRSFERMSLITRLDSIIIGISVHNYFDLESPDRPMIESLATRQLEHVASMLDGSTANVEHSRAATDRRADEVFHRARFAAGPNSTRTFQG